MDLAKIIGGNAIANFLLGGTKEYRTVVLESDNQKFVLPVTPNQYSVTTGQDNHVVNILDFGGSLGSSYFQNRKLLEGIPVEWNVVEQANFVDYGRREVPEINFHYKISDCKDKNINCHIYLQYNRLLAFSLIL